MRPDQSEQTENFFSGTDVKQIDFNSMDTFFRRKQIWVMLFYKSNEQASKDIKNEFMYVFLIILNREFVNKMYGIFETGAIDCIEEEELWSEFLVFETPSIVVFTEDASDDGQKYTGEFKKQKISNFASKKMQSFLSIVHNDNYQNFIEREPENYKVLIFSDRKSQSPLLKHLSKIYNDKLLFGFVRKDEKELISRFGIQKFPTIIVLTNQQKDKGDVFEGEISLKNLQNFFREYAYFKKNKKVVGTKLSKS